MATGGMSIGVLVPAEACGRLIGKQGSGLRQLREGSGCKVEVLPAGDRSEPRRANLTGDGAAIGNALSGVLHVIAQDQKDAQVVLFVASSMAGSLIGKAGANLASMRQNFGVKMTVERDPVQCPSTGEPERQVSVIGEPGSIGQALGQVLGKVGGGGAGGGMGGGMPTGGGMPRGGGMMGGGAPQKRTSGGGGGGGNGPTPGSPQDVQPVEPDMIQVHMAVPTQFVGAIVGEEGSTIAQMSAESGCRMAASARPAGSEHYIVIVGGLHAVCMAQQLLDRMVQQVAAEGGVEHDVNTKAVFWVQKEASGVVIGKAGSTLAQIREQAGVKVNFCRDEVRGMRPCEIQGLFDNVIQAETLLHNLLEERQQTQAAKRPADFEDDMDGLKRPRTMGGGVGPSSFHDFQDPAIRPLPPSSGGGAYATPGQAAQGEQQGAQQTKLLIPARTAGLIIGKQGAGLAKLRAECACKLELLQAAKAPHFPEDRVVIIQGPLDNRIQAVCTVLQTAFQNSEANASLKLMVDKRAAGMIIGKQGATLKQLRQSSGINCQVDKNEIDGERMVAGSGALPGIVALVSEIINMIGSVD